MNNWTQSDKDCIQTWPSSYCIYGEEVAPETGTPHLQGYVYFPLNKRLAACKKLHGKAHWAIAKGSTSQNVEYCSKGGVVTELGTRPSDDGGATGKRMELQRWDEARKAAREGRLDDIPSDIYVRYYRTLKEIARDNMTAPQALSAPCGVWLYGPPGCGKSTGARKRWPDPYCKGQNKWWDGYSDQDAVLLDDFDCAALGHHLKIWADSFPFIAETKGGAIFIRPRTFVVTSNYLPGDFWTGAMLEAVERRFTIEHMVSR